MTYNSCSKYLDVNLKIPFELILRGLHWSSVVLIGVEGSPCNFAPRLELLEPLRILAAGETSLVAFNRLSTKYVQVS
jgi:hypothetical protein